MKERQKKNSSHVQLYKKDNSDMMAAAMKSLIRLGKHTPDTRETCNVVLM
jgi:hypothetical protein